MEFFTLAGSMSEGIIIYLFSLWFVNWVAYFSLAYGMMRISKALESLRLQKFFFKFSVLLTVFGSIRFYAGLDALTNYLLGLRSSALTVELLGLVSVTLNVAALSTFAVFSIRESLRIAKETQESKRIASAFTETTNNLQVATDIAKRKK